MFVEQAIFTSLRSHRQEGYQVAAVSPGIDGDTARELSQWGPAHGSLIDDEHGTSLNFHPLCGAYCISKTWAAGEEYSGRGGSRIYTQMLVVPEPLLDRFACSPWAIADALVAAGKLEVHDHPPERLEPLAILGRASPVQPLLMSELLAAPGADALAAALQLATGSKCLAVRTSLPLERLFRGMQMLLPKRWRAELSFSTGLRYSPRRPVKLVAMPAETKEQKSLERDAEATLFDMSGDLGAVELPMRGWAASVRDCLHSGNAQQLAEFLRRAEALDEPGLMLDELAQRVAA